MHRDSELLTTGDHESVKTLEDRVPVLMTGKGFEHSFGVPVSPKGSGEQLAIEVIPEVDRFGLRYNIKCISYDTTSSNTGIIQGACTRN